jgi:Mce-associated membrane protein
VAVDVDTADDQLSESGAPDSDSDADQTTTGTQDASEPVGRSQSTASVGVVARASTPRLRSAAVIVVTMVCTLGGLAGWLGHRAVDSLHIQQQRNVFLQVGRQAAINLTTISYTEVDQDVQRVLDASTGAFHDDFQKRSAAFVEVVKQAQSKSEGTIADAGLESALDIPGS